jgi:hypothetical protein
MRVQRPILILLLVLTFSVGAQAQREFARSELEAAIEELRVASQANQEGPGIALRRDAQTFVNSREVKTKDFDSPGFSRQLENLKTRAEGIGRDGPLVKAVRKLHEKKVDYDNTAEEPKSPTPTPKLAEAEPSQESSEGLIASLTPYASPFIQGLIVLSAFGLLLHLAIGLRSLRRQTNEHINAVLPQAFGLIRKNQDALAKQIEVATNVGKDTQQGLTDVYAEIRQMSRVLQQTTLVNNRTAAPSPTFSTPAAPTNSLPVFPIAADQLLREMHRKSLVVKRDFQNDMLVSDPEGKGELVLLRDPEIREELQRLLVVPSVTLFQMRQDYHNFYEKYYDCARPESGDIWIIDPAVVEKVSGGWQLREKGKLEVR